MYKKDFQYYRFCAYGFLKNLRFFEPFLIIILSAEGLSFTKIPTLYAIREITRNTMEIPAGAIADTFGRKRSMVLAFSSYVTSFMLFYFATSYVLYISGFLLIDFKPSYFSFGSAFQGRLPV